MVETSSPLRIVLVEDNKTDRLLFREAFQKSEVPFDIAECARAEEALELLGADASSFDVVAVDHNLPGISGMDLCRKLLDNKTPLPLVLMTEMGFERLAAEALRSGVHNYIIKDPERGYLELLPMSLANTARQHADCRSYKQIEQTLRSSDKAASAFFDAIPDTAILADTSFNILFVNKAGAAKIGVSVDDLINKDPHKFFPEDVYELRRSKAMEVIRTGKIVSFEDERDGICFETWICPVFDTQGEVERLAVFAHDITDRRKAENALIQSEEKFRLAMEATNDALWDWNFVTNEVYRNPRHATMLGYESHELTASQEKWGKRIHPDDRQSVFKILDEHLAGKKDSFEIEYRLRTKSGDYVWVLGRGKVVAYSEDGSPARMIGTNIDITDRKKLRDRDEIILKTCIDGFWLLDINGCILEINDAYCRMSGYSRDELLTMNLQDVEAVESPQEAIQHIRKIMDRGSHRFESRHRCKDGTIMDLDISAHYLELDGGRIFTFLRDITEYKAAEEALQESERRYRTLFETSPVGVGLSTFDGRILDTNSTFQQMMGYSHEDMRRISVLDTYDNHEDRLLLLKRLEQEDFVRGFEVHLKRKDGTTFMANLNVTRTKVSGETVLVTVARDITEQRRTERALAESEEKYRTLVECARDPIFTIDKGCVLLFTNKVGAENLGYRPEDLAGKTLWDLFPKEIADRQAAIVRKTIETGQGINSISAIETQNKPRWYSVAIEPLRDNHGRASTAIVIARDIDDMKRAEEQIKKLNSVVEQSIDGIAIGGLEDRLLYVNDTYAHMHGYTPEEMIGMKITTLYPQDKSDVYENAIKQTKTRGAWRYEVEHVRKDGSTFPAYLSVSLQKDDKGDTVGYIAVCRDMTEYKRTQEILDIKNAALESSINGIVIGNIEGNLTYVNNSFLKMWDYEDKSEVLGRNASQFWKVNDKAAEIKNALQNGEGWIGELTAVRKNGSKFNIQVCQTSIKDENGRIVSLMGSFVDISESKRREEELMKYRGQMARAEQLASLGTLSATVAHQLTQPLTVIRLSMDNALDELEATSSSETVIRRLKDSVTQVSNITTIVDRFRNFARKSSGRTVAEVDLKAVAVRIARLLSESARSAGIVLRLRNMGGLPCPWMNETDLEQLFFALIENAIQAANGKKACQLVISGGVKHDHIELHFSDNCGGISPENLDKIFEPFFTTKPRGQGTGLGLCIVQDVASRTGGHVRVENKFGKGTTFIISLPVDQGKIS